MRTRETELGLGSIRIEDIKINLKSRDDIPALLLGLQAIHGADDTRERLFELLEHKVAPTVRSDTGRPGMTYWQILVLGVLQMQSFNLVQLTPLLGVNFRKLQGLKTLRRSTSREIIKLTLRSDH